ncbi:uncharacterized protein LOC122402417 isoform X2 [Colletes gigas]|uniref:uncharacterized protein LOC122402417 isoform X2 n=1 Tax=Colletes gigas TaxID=935657 RepID=UPI001C9A341E|nr:uncharacterized protein LOC122402417 isoform X2 [Colletes gigas]
MAEAVMNGSSLSRFFCHRCNIEIEGLLPDYTCPRCASGFIEELESGSNDSSSGIDFSHLIEDLGDIDDLSTYNYPNFNDLERYDLEHDELEFDELPELTLRLPSPRPTANAPNRNNVLPGRRGVNWTRSNSDTSLSGSRRRGPQARIIPNLLRDFLLHLARAGPGHPQNRQPPVFNIRLFLGNPGDYVWGQNGLDTIVTQMLNQLDGAGPPPLPRKQIDEIPTTSVTQCQVDSKLQCSVCWEDFRVLEAVKQLPCQHLFHSPCIVPWLELHRTCPICRQRLGGQTSPEANQDIVGSSLAALFRAANESNSTSSSSTSSTSENRSSSRNSNSEYVPLYNSEDNISETGSLFDYTEELKNILQEPRTESDCMSNSNIVLPEFYEPKCCIKIEKEEVENLLDAETLNQSEVVQKTIDIKTENYDVDVKTEVRSVTPVLTAEVLPGSQKSITPENRVNVLQQISYDSIKKSHRKNKGVNRKQFFSSKVLPCKLEAAEQDDGDCLENSEHDQSIDESKLIVDENNLDTLEMERACTPEKVNSSRLLLSQFSSVKRSHKKDKHTKILSGFLKRQEYFNKEIDFDRDTKDKAFDIDDGLGFKKSTEDLSDFDNTANSNDSSYLLNMSSDTSSPSKRKISLNTSSDRDANASYDSELQECDVPQEEFQIFTPLKRKRSLIAPAAKEYLHFYDLPSGNDEISEEAIANVSFSRCLTPVPSLQENYMKSGENHLATVKSDNVGSNDKTGRSTPRNMSTEELYNNLDSIKKSHKKNKRGNILRKGFDSIRNNLCEGKGQISSDNIKEEICEKLEISNDSIAVYDANKSATDESIDHDNFESLSSSSASDQNLSTTDPTTALQNVTPPNSFKAKNYLRVLQETSIKRSHKKVRDQKKHNFKIDTNELSDDGSIFGDSDELVCMDEQPARE